jgi:aminoglycoside phosphotransferase (APT) family kinase protein
MRSSGGSVTDATRQTVDLTPGPGLDVEPGPKLASGRDADVFDLGDGRVLRRNKERSKTSEYEAEVMRYVGEWGYPVPVVYEVSGPDMVMERVDGPTMLRDMGARPWMAWHHARTLAKLHRQLHGIPAPDWVPTYASHPAFAGIASVDELLAPSPGPPPLPAAPDAILHLDLHPDNVILSPSGPVVIDWRNTRRGDGAIDVATTWLIMATSQVPENSLKWRVIDKVRRLFVAALLRNVDRAAATRQLPLVARYRLADRNLRDDERPPIEAMVRLVRSR